MSSSSARSAGLAVALTVVLACASDDPQVTITVEGSPRTDWPAAVAPCLDPTWDYRVAADAPGRARVTVPARQYDPGRTVAIIRCLEDLPDISRADVPGNA